MCCLYRAKLYHYTTEQQKLSPLNVYLFVFLQMSAHTWIQSALLGLLIVNNVASQTCSTPFEAVFAGVTDITLPDSVLVLVGLTAMQQTEQVMQNALEHFNTQFGLDFSNIAPDSNNVRFFENACKLWT